MGGGGRDNVPHYLQATASSRRQLDPNDRRSVSPRPDIRRADHTRPWNAAPKPPPGETWGGAKRRQDTGSRSPEPTGKGRAVAEDDKNKTIGKQGSERTLADAEKGDRSVSPSVASRGLREPELGRVRGMQHKTEPPMPDPEADLARVLSMMQLPCTNLVLTKIDRESVTGRMNAVLDQCLPTNRRMPRPASELQMQSVSSCGNGEVAA